MSEVATPWLCLQHDLRLQGVDPARIDRVTDRTMADNLEALRRGELDVVQMFEPYVSMASQTGAGEVLYAASARGPTSYTTFLASRDSIRRNRAAFDAMVRAVRRSLAWVAEHSGAELADAVASFYPHVPRELLTSSLQRYHDARLWARTPDLSREGFARLADSMKSGGFISRLHAYEDCVEQSFSLNRSPYGRRHDVRSDHPRRRGGDAAGRGRHAMSRSPARPSRRSPRPVRSAADSAQRVIDATGNIVMPGGIDPHVHLQHPWIKPDGTPLYHRRDPSTWAARRCSAARRRSSTLPTGATDATALQADRGARQGLRRQEPVRLGLSHHAA